VTTDSGKPLECLRHSKTGSQPADVCEGKKDCNLLLYLTTKSFWCFQNVFENVGESKKSSWPPDPGPVVKRR